MVHSAVQISLIDMSMVGSSGASVTVTSGMDAQDQSMIPGIDAPTDGVIITFVELELAFEASIVNLSIFDNGIWIEEQSKDTNRQKETKQTKEMKMDESEDRQEHLTCRRVAHQTA
ncbi:hypothetical protein H5410_040555 [Solanum commersonii]|uniref:Uncharacterized protein n=1 Tax=Solanum commersonii TaxID=4109 RepID=A0A9J5XP95_SOLCO|nr:hypothetical protein H5410_040555 [Solanum commersonii]